MIKIPFHSLTDLITNSSTTIFTYSGTTIEPLKKMVNEMLKVVGQYSSFDDMFDAVVLAYDAETYIEHYFENKDYDDKLPQDITESEEIEKLYNEVKEGKIEKPEWFKDAEESENSYSGYSTSTYLYLIPKDEKYQELGKKIEKFLYSPNHDGTYDG